MSATIEVKHRSRPAYVYVRQSTLAQVRHNQESTERQYALREKALALGWTAPTIRTLDRDLGLSGAQMAGREDFKTLVADVSMGQVGAVFAFEVSRLARSNLDWHRLLELRADGDFGHRCRWLLRPGGLQRWIAARTQGHDGASGAAFSARAPPRR